jgi:hypothetical protein
MVQVIPSPEKIEAGSYAYYITFLQKVQEVF